MRLAAVEKQAVAWVAAQWLGDAPRQAALPLQVLPMSAPQLATTSRSGETDGDLIRIMSDGQDHPTLIRVEAAFNRIGIHAYSLASHRVRIERREDLLPYSLAALRGVAYALDLTRGHLVQTQTRTRTQTQAPKLTQYAEPLFRLLQAERARPASGQRARPASRYEAAVTSECLENLRDRAYVPIILR